MYGTFWRSLKALTPSVLLMGATVAVIVVGTLVPATAAVRVRQFSAKTPNATPPVLVVLGDSTAYTLGFALTATAPKGVNVINGGLFGCGLAIGEAVAYTPPAPQFAMFPACNSATAPQNQWPAIDTRVIANTTPNDLVVFLAGNWETEDILRDGKWTNIEQPSYQKYLRQQMRLAVQIGTAQGAHFDFATMPAAGAAATSQNTAAPHTSNTRRLIYNDLIKEVAAEYPGRVSILNYAAILSPHGVFTQYQDGVQIRTADGEHTPAYVPGNAFAGNSTEPVAHAFYNWLSPRIWPLIIASNRTSPTPASTAHTGQHNP